MSFDVSKLGMRVLEGYQVTREEALALCDQEVDVYDLMYWANKIRRKYRGDEVKACSIISVKTGACSEDCSFCSQSSRWKTNSPVHDFLPPAQVRAAAEAAKESGSYALGIVAQGFGPREGDIDRYIEYMDQIGEIEGVEKHINIGIMTEDQVVKLKEHGMVCCGHNLETSRRRFNKICSTHTYDQRMETLGHLKKHGVKICSGGLFGMGEDWSDRVDLALELREIGAANVPMNFLNQIDGTPLADSEAVDPMEILKTVALYRIILFDRDLGVYGGREIHLRDLQAMIFFAGASALMVGNYLTTQGRPAMVDRQMVADLKLKFSPARQLVPLR